MNGNGTVSQLVVVQWLPGPFGDGRVLVQAEPFLLAMRDDSVMKRNMDTLPPSAGNFLGTVRSDREILGMLVEVVRTWFKPSPCFSPPTAGLSGPPPWTSVAESMSRRPVAAAELPFQLVGLALVAREQWGRLRTFHRVISVCARLEGRLGATTSFENVLA